MSDLENEFVIYMKNTYTKYNPYTIQPPPPVQNNYPYSTQNPQLSNFPMSNQQFIVQKSIQPPESGYFMHQNEDFENTKKSMMNENSNCKMCLLLVKNTTQETITIGNETIKPNEPFYYRVYPEDMLYRYNIDLLTYRTNEPADKIWIKLPVKVQRFVTSEGISKSQGRIYFILVDSENITMSVSTFMQKKSQGLVTQDFPMIYARLALNRDESIMTDVDYPDEVLFVITSTTVVNP